MSNRQYQTAYVIGERVIDLAGSFMALAGAGVIDATKVTGLGFGFAPSAGVMAIAARIASSPLISTPGILRTATGLYTVTFEDSYLEMVAFSCDLAPASASGNWIQPLDPVSNIGSSTRAPTVSMQIINSSGTATDSASRIHFFARFRDSTTRYGKP